MQLSSKLIRDLRCRLGWSRSEMAHKLGVQPLLIGDWENGAAAPTPELSQTLEILFMRAESSALEILETPKAERLLDSTKRESVNQRDLARDGSEDSSV